MWRRAKVINPHVSMHGPGIISQEQQSLNHVEAAVHAELVVVNGLSLARRVIADGPVDAECEVRVGVVLRPVESNRLAGVLAIEVNVAESRCDFVDLGLLCQGIQVERLRSVVVRLLDELIHHRVID